jgi:serine/threonine protein kinase
MTTHSAAADDDELLLVQFMDEPAERLAAALEEYIRRAPHLAERLQALARTKQALCDVKPDAEPPMPERLGEFRIVRCLAHGGMGEIYEAVQEPLGRSVAVKTIRRGHLSPLAEARFLREQKVLADLHQTHIVPIHTAGKEGELQYFAMP